MKQRQGMSYSEAGKLGAKIGCEIVQNKWQKIIKEYDKNPNHCIVCNKSLSYYKRNKQFCGSSCSATYNNQHRFFKPSEDKRTKIIKCAKCGKEIEENIRAGKNTKCSNCKTQIKTIKIIKINGKETKIIRKIRNPKIPKLCKYCGQEKCLRPDICRKHQLFPALINYFGLNKSKIGTIDFYEEFDRIRNKLIEEYINQKRSLVELKEKYNHHDIRNFNKLFDSLKIPKRNNSDSVRNAVFNGRYKLPSAQYPYKHGWHTTWDNKKVFYRSSYELDYAKELDKQQIEYEMEKLRILYWDSQRQIQRVAIPDFYLPKQNKIVEIKSPWTLDKQNMKDKEKAYKEHGYVFELIVGK
jgi:hypothetical protein